MTRYFAILIAAGLCACSSSTSSSGSTGSSGSGSTGGSTGDESPTIAVSGTVVVHPVAEALHADGVLTHALPSTANDTVFVDEPLLVISEGTAAGRLATVTADASGNFTAPSVPTDSIIIGLVGTVAASSPDGGLRSCETTATDAFCTQFAQTAGTVYENGRPTADVSGKLIYGVPEEMSEKLSVSLGEAEGQHLLDQGYVLGYVVGADGGPLAGVTFDKKGKPYDVHYFGDGLEPDAGATNKYGMFVIVAPGQPDPSHTFGIVGHDEFKCHAVGSNPGSVFALVYDAANPGVDCK